MSKYEKERNGVCEYCGEETEIEFLEHCSGYGNVCPYCLERIIDNQGVEGDDGRIFYP